MPEGDEPFRLRIPEGAAMLYGGGEGIGNFQREIMAKDGLELTIAVGPRTGVVIKLMHAGKPVDWPRGRGPQGVLGESSPGDLNDMNDRSAGSRFFGVSEPGLYTFNLPKVEGYELHAPIEVDIVKGQETQIDVELIWIP